MKDQKVPSWDEDFNNMTLKVKLPEKMNEKLWKRLQEEFPLSLPRYVELFIERLQKQIEGEELVAMGRKRQCVYYTKKSCKIEQEDCLTCLTYRAEPEYRSWMRKNKKEIRVVLFTIMSFTGMIALLYSGGDFIVNFIGSQFIAHSTIQLVIEVLLRGNK